MMLRARSARLQPGGFNMAIVANYDKLEELTRVIAAILADTDNLMRPSSVARELHISRQAANQLLLRGTLRSVTDRRAPVRAPRGRDEVHEAASDQIQVSRRG